MQIDQLPSYVVTIVATNHAELLDRAVWRRFQLRLSMPQPSLDTLAVFLDRQFESWQESLGIEVRTLASQLGPISFAEALEFCQTIRRRHTLSLGKQTLRDILYEQLQLWTARVSPEEANATRSGEASPSLERSKRHREAPIPGAEEAKRANLIGLHKARRSDPFFGGCRVYSADLTPPCN
jgi:hypothetical protein